MKAGKFKYSESYLAAFGLVLEFFNGDYSKATLWFTTLNPLLGMIRPIDMVLLGRTDKLLKLIKNQLDQNKRD